MIRHVIKNRVNIESASVGKCKFQEISPQHQPHAGHNIFIRKNFLFMELRQQVSRALNRPCNQLRKERNEQGVSKEIPLYSDLALIYINRIAQCLKNIERNPDRKQKVKMRELNSKPYCISKGK